jgi:hypothetical protein
VFRFIYRQPNPVGIHDVQRGLGLSSPSLAYYHINKLLKAGLLKEESDGYAVDKVVFESMIRIRKTVVPFQTTYAVFSITARILLLTTFRPQMLSSSYLFSVAVVLSVSFVFVLEVARAMREP